MARKHKYEGWNSHRFEGMWHCRGCGRWRYRDELAWYIGVMHGPYCLRCRAEIEQPERPLGVLTDSPRLDKMDARGNE